MHRVDDLDIGALGNPAQPCTDPFEAAPKAFAPMAGDQDEALCRIEKPEPFGQRARQAGVARQGVAHREQSIDNRIAGDRDFGRRYVLPQ
jgi:hypothetical protein